MVKITEVASQNVSNKPRCYVEIAKAIRFDKITLEIPKEKYKPPRKRQQIIDKRSEHKSKV